ncbi:MAG: hypothetical protein RLZZ623_1959 [Actinomycetota bacterium]
MGSYVIGDASIENASPDFGTNRTFRAMLTPAPRSSRMDEVFPRPFGCKARVNRVSGAGGNRTPVHQAKSARATTIPDSLPNAGRPAGRLATGYPAAHESSFRIVISLS